MVHKFNEELGLNFDLMDSLTHDLYNAISKVMNMRRYQRVNINKEDFETIIDEVVINFLDGEDYDFSD